MTHFGVAHYCATMGRWIKNWSFNWSKSSSALNAYWRRNERTMCASLSTKHTQIRIKVLVPLLATCKNAQKEQPEQKPEVVKYDFIPRFGARLIKIRLCVHSLWLWLMMVRRATTATGEMCFHYFPLILICLLLLLSLLCVISHCP